MLPSRNITGAIVWTISPAMCRPRASAPADAPRCLPTPMAAIFIRPDSIGPTISVCALIRLHKINPSQASASEEKSTFSPSTSPSSVTSRLEMISQPVVSGVKPMPSSICRCPSAVAPPWLPMAGMITAEAPFDFTQSASVRTISGIFAMPRLPTVIPIRCPGLTVSANSGSASCSLMRPATSSSRGAGRS